MLEAHEGRQNSPDGGVPVEQYCPTVGAVVTLKVKGEACFSTVSGVVESCSAGKCGELRFYWLNRNILTAIP